MKHENNSPSQKTPALWAGLKKRNRRWNRGVLLLLLAAAALICFMMVYGNTVYSPRTIFAVLKGAQIQGASYTILTLRLPRMLCAVLAGFAFGMSGFIFQSVLHNSLASPDIIGVTSSTSTAAVVCISLFGMSGIPVSSLAVVTGITVSLLIYFLSSKGGFSHGRMILIGIGVQAIADAVTSYVLSRTSEYDVAETMRWMSGSLNNADLKDAAGLAIVVVLGGLLLLSRSQSLRMLEIGDDFAQTLGASPKTSIPLLVGAAVLMIAVTTAAVGPIASVAFLSGPVATRITGRSKSGILPAALVGCVLILAADMAGQYAFPARYPVGVITGLLGAPYLLYLLITMTKKGETI